MLEEGWKEFLFFQELRRWDRVARYSTPSPTLPLLGGGSEEYSLMGRMAMGRRVEVIAGEILAERGHPVRLTSHKKAWDLRAGGARVEVKAARWRGGRYQAAIRNHEADLVLMACVLSVVELAWFVIPAAAIGERRNLAIWSADPELYSGRWARYLEAWELADEVIEAAGPWPWQMVMAL